MTVTYSDKVAHAFNFGNFWRLLFVWRGSVYKLVWPEFLVYMGIYFSLSFLYRFGLTDPESKLLFELVAGECDRFSKLIPLSFVLGFYVSLVVSRWWDQYNQTPWPDNLCVFIASNIEGTDKQSRLTRRTIARYVNLTWNLTFRMISSPAKKRFPTFDHLIDAGLLEENEKLILEKLEKLNDHPKYFIPIIWAGSIVKRARRENMIKDDYALKTLLEELNKFRGCCGALIGYDWINIPLVYTQVVTLAVYTFFISTTMGRQFLAPGQDAAHRLDYYIPVFSILQFLFYMGWLKVAEVLLNPFGEDDDDFEVNYLVDRNLQISYMIVDDMLDDNPEMVQDKFWEGIPRDLRYTMAAAEHKIDAYQGSASDYEVAKEMQQYMSENPESIKNVLLSSGRTLTSLAAAEETPEPFKAAEEPPEIQSYKRIQRNYSLTVSPTQALIRNLTARKFNADDYDWGDIDTSEKLPDVRITVTDAKEDKDCIGGETIQETTKSADDSSTNLKATNIIDTEECAGSRSSLIKYMESRKKRGSLNSSVTDNEISVQPAMFRRFSSTPRPSTSTLNIGSPSPKHTPLGSQNDIGGSEGNLTTPQLVRKEAAKFFKRIKRSETPKREISIKISTGNHIANERNRCDTE